MEINLSIFIYICPHLSIYVLSIYVLSIYVLSRLNWFTRPCSFVPACSFVLSYSLVIAIEIIASEDFFLTFVVVVVGCNASIVFSLLHIVTRELCPQGMRV